MDLQCILAADDHIRGAQAYMQGAGKKTPAHDPDAFADAKSQGGQAQPDLSCGVDGDDAALLTRLELGKTGGGVGMGGHGVGEGVKF